MIVAEPTPSSASDDCDEDLLVDANTTVSSNTGCRYVWRSGDLEFTSNSDAGNVIETNNQGLVYTDGDALGTLTVRAAASLTAGIYDPAVLVGLWIGEPQHYVLGVVNEGLIEGDTAAIFLNGGGLGTLENIGELSGDVGVYLNGLTELDTLLNDTDATIVGGYAGIRNSGAINRVTNRGTIDGGTYGVDNLSAIEEIRNDGTILGMTAGIRNTGTLGMLKNRQSGLSFIGRAPASYFTAIEGTDDGEYGTLIVKNAVSWGIGAMEYGIAKGSTVIATTYQDVIQSSSSDFDSEATKTGEFTSHGIAFDYSLVFDGTHWDLVVSETPGPPAEGGSTVTDSVRERANLPAASAARVIDANEALRDLFSENTSTSQEASDAATEALPLLTGGGAFAAQNAIAGISRVVQARTEGNRGLSSGDDFYGDDRFWLKPFGSWAAQGTRSGVAGYDLRTYGVAVGMDGAPWARLRLGGALAYARASVDGRSSVAEQNSDIDVYQVIGYGSYSMDQGTDLSFQLDLGKNATKGERRLGFVSSTASSDYSSYTGHVALGIGRTHALGGNATLTPSLRADYSRIQDDAYRESGAGLLNLDVDRQKTDALLLGFDSRVAYRWMERTTLIATLGVGFDAINERAASVSSFAGAPGAQFRTQGIDPSPWVSRGGLSAIYETAGGLQFTARYDAEGRASFLNQTLSVKVRWPF